MPGPWITEDDLRQRLADTLSQDVGDINAKWDKIITGSLFRATKLITAKLLGRGYTITQVDLWDQRFEYSYLIGLYWCLCQGNGLGTYNDVFVNKFNVLEELDTLALMVDNIIITPTAGVDATDDINGGGAVSGGDFRETGWRFNRCKRF